MPVPEGLPVAPARLERSIRTVAVIGAGEQGRAFALRCVRAGISTVLEDVMPARLRQARQELSSLADAHSATRLSFALTVEDAVREADLAIDFVPDELESKLEIFSMVDRMAPPRTILCTPTQSLSISDLAACTYRAERCVALHTTGAGLATNPAAGFAEGLATDRLQLIRGQGTSPEVLVTVVEWLGRLAYAVETIEDSRYGETLQRPV